MARCNKCGAAFRTLEGEGQDHECPRCGWAPWNQQDDLESSTDCTGKGCTDTRKRSPTDCYMQFMDAVENAKAALHKGDKEAALAFLLTVTDDDDLIDTLHEADLCDARAMEDEA